MAARGGPERVRFVLGIVLVAVGIGLLVWIVIRPPRPGRDGVGRDDTNADAPEPGTERPRAQVPAPAPVETPHPAPAAASPVAPAPRGDGTDERGKENETMARIRASVRSDPDGALALIEAADRAHPDGPLAEERAALRVDALVFAQRIGLARDAAEEFLRRYPQGDRAQHIEMLTGVHPHPPDD